jgi:isopenicillin-N N-acyltransferase-like protein
MESPYPVVSVSGDAHECGRQHGAQARELVQRNVEYYLEYWSRSLRMDRSWVMSYGEEMLSVIKRFDVVIYNEVIGVSEGSEVDAPLIAALNARYELAWASPSQLMGGCTCIAATPNATREGETLMAQNWDYRLGAREGCIVLDVAQDGKPGIVMHTEAGIIGQKGMNSAGLALTVNAMVSERDRLLETVPFFVVCRAMLNCGGFADAVGVFASAKRSVSYNVMLAGAGVAVDLEAHPFDASIIYPEDGVLCHTNHFIGDRSRFVIDEYIKSEPSSVHRYLVARERLRQGAGDHGLETFKEILRDHYDHPTSICYHPDPRLEYDRREETICSVVFSPERRLFLLTRGPPCAAEYHELRLKTLLGPES